MRKNFLLPTLVAWLFAAATIQAHPVPDIPVKTSFSGDVAKVRVEIDPRSFTDDPEGEPYLYHHLLKRLSDEDKQELKEKGQELVDRTIAFQFKPERSAHPELKFRFAGIGGAPLEDDEDPVMLVGTVELQIPEGSTGYQVIADESGELSVVFENEIDGKKHSRVNVLFPGESSFVLDIGERRS
ncbi:MAG: hypothetical protein WD342_02335 [Verrucomicrobiales bacterium]